MDCLFKIILQESLQGGCRRAQQRISGLENIIESAGGGISQSPVINWKEGTFWASSHAVDYGTEGIKQYEKLSKINAIYHEK